MQIRHKMNKGIATVDDDHGAKLVESEHSVWELLAPKAAAPKKAAPAKAAPAKKVATT